jgi:hypothetical protein
LLMFRMVARTNLASTGLQLEEGPPWGVVCKYNDLMAPGTANQKAAVISKGSRQDLKTSIQGRSRFPGCQVEQQ